MPVELAPVQAAAQVLAPRSGAWDAAAPPTPMPAPIWRTVVATFAIALGLSVLPLPDGWRPIPELRAAPKDTLVSLVWPSRPAAPAEQPPAPELAEIELPSDEESPTDQAGLGLDLTGEPEGERPEVKAPRPKLRTEQSRKWDVLLSRVKGQHIPLVDPCRDAACTRTALTPWYEALEALESGKATHPVRAVTIGTSLIASDHITDIMRERLQTRYGNAGLGFMFVDRPTRGAGRTVRTGKATEGWVIEKVTDSPKYPHAGFGGAAFTAPADAPQETSFNAPDTRFLELFAVAQPQSGSVKVYGDGKPLGTLEIAGTPGTAVFPSLELPEGVTEVKLQTQKGPVRLDGVVLERATPGVVFDSLGLPGATATVLLAEEEPLVTAQLARRTPALVILMIGGNDAFDLSLNRYTVEKAKERMEQEIQRVQAAAPEAACLLASPPDAGVWTMKQTITARTQTRLVSEYMHALAEKYGCAWYDMQAAMGGEGAIERWWTAGLMNRDLVHPLGVGGDIMGYQLEEALDVARRKYDAKRAPAGGRRLPVSAPPRHRPRHRRQPGVAPLPVAHRSRHGQRGPHVELAAVQPGARDAGTTSSLRDAGAAAAGPDAGGSFTWYPADGGPEPSTQRPPAPPEIPTESGFLLYADRLTRFFTQLRALERKKQGRVAVLQLGASHTAGHMFTDQSRALLAERFGGAGRGFVAAGSSSPRLEKAGVSRHLEGQWLVKDALKQKFSGATWGLTGVRADGAPGAKFTIAFDDRLGRPDDVARLQVYYLAQKDAPLPLISIDRQPARIVAPPVEATGPRVLEFAAQGPKHEIAVINPGPEVLSLFGVSQELLKPGIVYDAMGLPGSTATTLASYDQGALQYQLKARQPDLFVLFYGTNESAQKPERVEEMRDSYAQIFSTLRAASPNADCLILGPTDRMSLDRRTRRWREAEANSEVTAVMQAVALQYGCAFWQTRSAMGGPGSMELWRREKLGNRDHVHLTTEGYHRLAEAMVGDLLNAYDGWKAAVP